MPTISLHSLDKIKNISEQDIRDYPGLVDVGKEQTELEEAWFIFADFIKELREARDRGETIIVF